MSDPGPRCGRPLNRYEAVWGPLLEDPVCGRPLGHNGRCRSEQSLERVRERRRPPRVLTRRETFDPGQPRDWHGRWIKADPAQPHTSSLSAGQAQSPQIHRPSLRTMS